MKHPKPSSRKVPKQSGLFQRFSAGLIGGGATSAGDELIRSVQIRGAKGGVDPTAKIAEVEKKKVGVVALFKYSTTNERWLMLAGIVMAAVAGLSMPVWLLLLAESLETFNQIGAIVAAGGSSDVLMDEMNKLIYSFAIVGAVSLVSGTIYVAFWTYVGEQQTLRIRKKFVSSALRQEMAWFDTGVGDPQELPVMAANALDMIQLALGRSVADTFANLLSAVGCLMVALGLDASLALLMVCILPVIGIAIAIVFCFMRKYSGLALAEFASAGAFASEVITGIKTIASLRAEKWAVTRYTARAVDAQRFSVKSEVYKKLASGVMGLLFYATYTIAFTYGTYQVRNNRDLSPYSQSLP
jgi:ATP-binding cassette subfamily B (MDR/TAP) protein 1